MTPAAKKKLIGTNAAIWSVAILASFVLPMIAASISDGPARFLQVVCFAIPLITGMFISTSVISKSVSGSAN